MARLELYVIRHGIAEDRGPDGTDASRALTAEGVSRLREVASHLRAIGVWWDVVLTSPLVRARQTAEVLRGAKPDDLPESRVVVTVNLVPEARPSATIEEVAALPEVTHATGDVATRVALVSHEPLVSTLAARLLGSPAPLPFKKGGICRIDFDGLSPSGEPGLLRWFAPPKLLRRP